MGIEWYRLESDGLNYKVYIFKRLMQVYINTFYRIGSVGIISLNQEI
jgi:hypothetical protein